MKSAGQSSLRSHQRRESARDIPELDESGRAGGHEVFPCFTGKHFVSAKGSAQTFQLFVSSPQHVGPESQGLEMHLFPFAS
jgi:hypothetical protein